jgi:hypothetical protein
LGDLKKDTHEAALEKEICHRHLVPFLVTSKKGEKQTNSIPVKEAVSSVTLCNMAWMAKKDLLMADKERWWHLENPSESTSTLVCP